MTEPHDTGRQRPTPPDLASSQEEAVAETAAPEAFYATEDPIGVQHEGIEARQIIGFIFFLIIAIGLVVWGAMDWFESVADQAYEDVASDLDYPELRQVELSATQLLNHYEVINAAQGVYRIPVDRALDLIVEEAQQAPAAAYSLELQLRPGN